jgi:hypothetical protein
MPIRELMGASVEVADAGFDVADPVIDGPVAGGGGHLVAGPRRAILRIADVGTFAIANGERIRFDPDPGASPDAVSMWLHGSVAALLLAQRGDFALHASVVDAGGVGVAIAGPRGVGKSTTALRLAQRGHPLVTDDVSPLRGGDPVTVHPYSRPLHVWPHAAQTLGLDLANARPILPEAEKLALPTASRAPVELRAIAVLETSADEASVEVARVRGAQAHWLLRANTYRTELLTDLWQVEMFAWAGAIASSVAVHVVTRPAEGWTVDAVADTVERLIDLT